MAYNGLDMIDTATLNFYEKNKDLTWTMEEIPQELTADRHIANWILNIANIGWIELDLDIDIDRWKIESQVANQYFVDHRGQQHPGWNSCCIHGIDVDKTGSWTNYGFTNESDVPYTWTSLSAQTPNITKFWKDQFPIEKYRRIRFMELEPEGYIAPHSDAPGNLPGEYQGINILEHGAPINIAISHPSECYMTVEGYGCVPFAPGRAFMVNIRNYHSVINFSKEQRIHMIAHGWYGNRIDEFCELLIRSYRKQYAIYRQL
jgi:hypothetical protein